MDLNSKYFSDTVIPACFWLESSDLRRWMPASAGMTKYSGQLCAFAGMTIVWDSNGVSLFIESSPFYGLLFKLVRLKGGRV
jgi:hypothetical protein